MGGAERAAMIGMESVSATIPGGHAITPPRHACGDFKDEFDWSSLSLAYRKRIGAP